jgi:hypothetical protein
VDGVRLSRLLASCSILFKLAISFDEDHVGQLKLLGSERGEEVFGIVRGTNPNARRILVSGFREETLETIRNFGEPGRRCGLLQADRYRQPGWRVPRPIRPRPSRCEDAKVCGNARIARRRTMFRSSEALNSAECRQFAAGTAIAYVESATTLGALRPRGTEE